METYEERGYLDSEFRLFHLSDIPKQKFGFHYHDLGKIIIFLKGKVNYLIEGRAHPLMPYDTVPANHNGIHRPDIDQPVSYERIIVYLSPGFITSHKMEEYDLSECFQHAKTAYSDALCVRSPERSSLFQITRNLERVCVEEGYANEPYRQILFLEFMIQLSRTYLTHRLDYLKTRHSNQKTPAIMDYIGAHLSADLNIGTLLGTLYTSKHHMMRQFKQETGCTISHYINSKRLLFARELPSGDTPTTQIYCDRGLENHSTFSCAYKPFLGESPKLQRATRTR